MNAAIMNLMESKNRLDAQVSTGKSLMKQINETIFDLLKADEKLNSEKTRAYAGGYNPGSRTISSLLHISRTLTEKLHGVSAEIENLDSQLTILKKYYLKE